MTGQIKKNAKDTSVYTQRVLSIPAIGEVNCISLPDLAGSAFDKLPITIRIILESNARNLNGLSITRQHIERLLAGGAPAKGLTEEVPFLPARIVLQDFTGVPAIVDLAMLRDAVVERNANPGIVNPILPCDLVIDHSVSVDYAGNAEAQRLNERLEFERNRERYQFLKWGQTAFKRFRLVPPGSGIVHQVNLEYLTPVVCLDEQSRMAYPDSCLGTDSHTPTVCGLGVLAWGVGGIEAEAVMLGQPYYLTIPEVIGVRLDGELPPGATATDLALFFTQLCRKIGVVGKFLEFFGPGLKRLTAADRAAVANMAPEQGSTVSFFPIDELALAHLRESGRSKEQVQLIEYYLKEQGLFYQEDAPLPAYGRVVNLDLTQVEAALAGPKLPHQYVPLNQVKEKFAHSLTSPASAAGFGLSQEEAERSTALSHCLSGQELKNGSVVLAAITSCTNTSNPALMIGAGLLAKKAVLRGLRSKPYVKTSLSPGSRAVAHYLAQAGLLPYLEELGFYVTGYGCMTCIGNSGPLLPEVDEALAQDKKLVAAAVLSGNRNFEGRVHSAVRANYLASPPLVVAYAIAGSVAVDLSKQPLGVDREGRDVYLQEIWPSAREVEEVIRSHLSGGMFAQSYAGLFQGSPVWQELPCPEGELYHWDEHSTYIRKPSFVAPNGGPAGQDDLLKEAHILGWFGDSVTTDHISPAGSISRNSPAAVYLEQCGVPREAFHSYGGRRGNFEVMVRGTFANIRLKNKLVPGSEGNITLHHPSGETMSFYDAAMRYQAQRTPLIIIAGRDYGSGSSRDWAAKGPYLLGVRAVLAQSFERIHRSNLIGMGILPLEFLPGESAESLALDGAGRFSIDLRAAAAPRTRVQVQMNPAEGPRRVFEMLSRIDNPIEAQYFQSGGVLCYVLEQLLAGNKSESS